MAAEGVQAADECGGRCNCDMFYSLPGSMARRVCHHVACRQALWLVLCHHVRVTRFHGSYYVVVCVFLG